MSTFKYPLFQHHQQMEDNRSNNAAIPSSVSTSEAEAKNTSVSSIFGLNLRLIHFCTKPMRKAMRILLPFMLWYCGDDRLLLYILYLNNRENVLTLLYFLPLLISLTDFSLSPGLFRWSNRLWTKKCNVSNSFKCSMT
jgi:hypothetical protein